MLFTWSTGCVKCKTLHSGLDKNQKGCWEQMLRWYRCKIRLFFKPNWKMS